MPLETGMRASTLRALPPPDSQAITLNQVRSGPRHQNEYVESPGPPRPHTYKVPIHSTGHHVTHSQRITSSQSTVRNSRTHLANTVISNQPISSVSPPLKKDISDNDDSHMESIMCKNCGKCQCSACTDPRELPTRWCCGDTCECSAEKVIDTTTCFCAVKCAFYHCGGGGQDDNTCYEDPCACGPPHFWKRWISMSVMSLCFPCLCCYWPERLCLKAVTSCYNRCRKKGCQCGGSSAKKGNKCSQHSQTRRLLIESDSSSA